MRHSPNNRRITIDLRTLSGIDQATVDAMVDTLPDHVDIGDQRAIIVALAGRFDPNAIDRLLDHVTEQARIRRAALTHSGRLGELVATISLFALVPVVGIATLMPTDAMAAEAVDAVCSAPSGWLWTALRLCGVGVLGVLVGGCMRASGEADDIAERQRSDRSAA